MKNINRIVAKICICSMLVVNFNISNVNADDMALHNKKIGYNLSTDSVVAGEMSVADISAEYSTEESGENVTGSFGEDISEVITGENVTDENVTGEDITYDENTSSLDETTLEETSEEETVIETTTEIETTTVPETTTIPVTTVPETTTIPVTTVPETTKPETTKPVIEPWGEYNGQFYNDKGEVVKGAIAKGIDVSKYQGKIDWEEVSQSGVKFVIIRCGYGDDIKKQDDKYFKRNVEACEKYGIPYGVYLYSYAKNLTMAKSEVNHVLRMIKEAKANPTYPIYLDMEDNSQYVLSNKKLAEIADYFCSEMVKKGYQAGVYANLNWWNNKLTDKSFNQWHRWVAQYNSYCAFKGPFQMWQFTSTGIVNGVAGDTDINFLFYNECQAKGHSAVKWKTIKKATVLKKGEKKSICKKCGLVLQIKSTAKLKPTGKLNKKKITLKVKKKYKKLKVKGLARGDSVKKYKTSNKKIAKVSKKGVITAGKKKGKATITVVLKSGKKLKLTVKVKK